MRIQTGGFDKWSCKCNLSNIVGDACAKSRWKGKRNVGKRWEGMIEEKKKKANVKIFVQNLCKNLGTKDLDSLVVLETC